MAGESTQLQGNEAERDEDAKSRREFLTKVGRVGVAAPAVALLLAASSRPASARSAYLN